VPNVLHPQPPATTSSRIRCNSAISSHAVTTISAPPTLLYALMEQTATPRESFASLRHEIYSAAPMTPERIRDCQHFFGPVVERACGQVEAPQIISGMRAAELLDERNLTSVGRPSDVVNVGIMSPEGALLATGAVGLLDERGYLFIQGRMRETTNSGGFKIFRGDVEASLGQSTQTHLLCCAAGTERRRKGESPCGEKDGAQRAVSVRATACAAWTPCHCASSYRLMPLISACAMCTFGAGVHACRAFTRARTPGVGRAIACPHRNTSTRVTQSAISGCARVRSFTI